MDERDVLIASDMTGQEYSLFVLFNTRLQEVIEPTLVTIHRTTTKLNIDRLWHPQQQILRRIAKKCGSSSARSDPGFHKRILPPYYFHQHGDRSDYTCSKCSTFLHVLLRSISKQWASDEERGTGVTGPSDLNSGEWDESWPGQRMG